MNKTAHLQSAVNPDGLPALVLNADFTPLSYYPLSLWSWQDVTSTVLQDKAIVVSTYDKVIRSPSFEMNLPSVIALKKFVKQKPAPAFTRFNLFLRDGFCCQYCDKKGNVRDLTFDHVKPRSRGGQTNWENIVAACYDCNMRKADREQMQPRRRPFQPTHYQLQESGKLFPPRYLHSTWLDNLYWDISLEVERDGIVSTFTPSRVATDVPEAVIDEWYEIATPARSAKSLALKPRGLHAA